MTDPLDVKPNKVDAWRVERSDYQRVGGGVICDHCGFEIYDHPPVVGYPWLKRLCNGKLVKT